MCIIIDANIIAFFFNEPNHKDNEPVHKWIEEGDGRLIYGGQLKKELSKVKEARRILAGWKRAGIALDRSGDKLDAQELIVKRMVKKSDDPHVLALALESGARILYTDDKNLMTDFKNRNIIPTPPGKIYRRGKCKPTLEHCPGCPGYTPSRKKKKASRKRKGK